MLIKMGEVGSMATEGLSFRSEREQLKTILLVVLRGEERAQIHVWLVSVWRKRAQYR